MRGGRLNSDRAQLGLGIGVVAAMGLLPGWLGGSYWEQIFLLVNIYVVVAVMQNFLFMDAGQKSFGQGAIFGMGAYGFAIAVGLGGASWPLGVLAAIGGAVLGGVIFALPALRVQGFHLGFATLSAAIVFPQLLVEAGDFTGGLNGISMFLPALLQPTALGVGPLSIVAIALASGALALHYMLRRARLGRRMRIAAESAEAAGSLGIRSGWMRFAAFIIASAVTGLAGALYVPAVGFISPQGFAVELSFIFFFAVVVGGRGQILGPVVGLWVVYILPNVLLVELLEYRLLVNGMLTLLVVILFPDGLVGTVEAWRKKRLAQGGGEGGFTLDPFTSALETLPQHEVPEGQILEMDGITKRFGKVVALDGVDFSLRAGEVHGLVGANGSGKTSLLNVISGFSRANEGRYSMSGQDMTQKGAAQIARAGLGRTFQTPRIFPALSVWDNIHLGLDARETDLGHELEEVVAHLREAHAEGNAARLSHGQRRLLEVARVALSGPRAVLFDEPAAGLSPAEREDFARLIRLLAHRLGMGVVLVEHDLDLVWGIADRITVLEQGRVVASGAPKDLARDPAVQHLFIGGDISEGDSDA